jgi:hypothetical protein
VAELNQARIAYFREQLDLTRKMAAVLRYSWERAGKVMPLLLQQELKPEQLEILEALGARFARLSDMLVQKLFRAVDALELIDEGSIIDRLNRMEKRGVIAKTEDWVEIRQIRNQIAHDYVLKDLLTLYETIYRHCPLLFQVMDVLEKYTAAQGWLKK